ncbi:DNA-binding response regulator [Lysinibacillus sp. 2017]|uniref:helix-turn-helix domain-containing protein n=1 Tax=unclassified Lysinibacillus TaxID=2636778 RepID=UPI000D525BB8|nr:MULTISPECIES: helix-turn-helix domain-containing protein [unclassified Lysinibacillus]AWE06077.1 DNA-binding response regulator [Lysinibacillus sp. 2017]TGN33355.1 AraC family transcriptional regulator [Lysinibacillus sp. S2017]
MRILIIERDSEEIKGIEWFLKNYISSRVEIQSATNSLELEALFSQFQPQILLIETEFLSLSVQHFLQKQDVHIIALTAQPIFQQALKAIQVKAVQLFIKPVPLDELKSTILALPIKNQDVATIAPIPVEAQLYLDLYLNTPKKIDLQQYAFFLLEPAQFKDNLALYHWIIQSPILEKLTAFPLQNRILCIIQVKDFTQNTKTLRLIIQEWMKFSEEEMNIAFYDGEDATLRDMYNDCKKALAQRFYKGYGHIFNSTQSLIVTRLDPLLTPETQQLWISSLEKGDLKAIKEFLYKLSNASTFYHHEDVRIHLTSILAQIRRFMMKYHLQQQAKIEAQYRELFHLILEHPILYAIVQEFILFTQMLMETVKAAQLSLHVDYAELAVSIIEQHYKDSALSLQMVAKELNISANYLSNLFSKKRGIPFKRFLQQYRVQQAEKLLIQSDIAIATIAEMVGFIDGNYFTKVFRDYYNVTPYRYRMQAKNNYQ